MEGLTPLEKAILETQRKETKKFLRLSSERDLYNFSQAAFRLNISRNTFENEFIQTGLLKKILLRGEWWIAKSDIDTMIENQGRYVPKSIKNNGRS